MRKQSGGQHVHELKTPTKPPPAYVHKGQKFKGLVYQWSDDLLILFSPCCYRRVRVSLVGVGPRRRKIVKKCSCKRCRYKWELVIYRVKGRWGPKGTFTA